MEQQKQAQRFEELEEQVRRNLELIPHKIVVFSGKGGVGKTTVSVNLACSLQQHGVDTSLLDADVTGPNVPKMLGLRGQLLAQEKRIVPLDYHGVRVISIASLLTEDQPVIWRGPMRSRLLSQFLGEADWGETEYLIADLPPGTGDEVITMTQQMHPDLAVIVTTPQEMSLIDSRRAVRMAQKMQIPRIGIVENMSELICPECGAAIDLFGSGGGKTQAETLGVDFFGALPVDITARRLADEGRSVIFEQPDSALAEEMDTIAAKIKNLLG